ncbi:MAG: metalloregulator ArsR/SmtB family transcription factor [Balneolales bacterium]|nr:metalloregulator ArsR/SmtB family transcription factor [Balneolales bacterium]
MAKLNDETLEIVAHRFKILGEPMRLRLLSALRDKEYCVQELVELTGAGQANVSKHLSLLASTGYVGRRKDGLHVYYFIQDPTVYTLCELVCDRIAISAKELHKTLDS